MKVKKGIWIILGALLLLAVIVPATATFYTDLLWFRERGLLQVFWTRLLPQWVLFAAAAAAAFVIFSLNWLRARRSAMREIAFASLPGEVLDIPMRASALAVVAVAAVLAVMNGLAVRSGWMTVLQYLNRTPFGRNDPVFGRDVAFYVFDIPFLSLLQGWLLSTLVTTLIGVALITVLAVLPRMRDENRFYLPPFARGHLSVLGALVVVLWGAGLWLERFHILLSPEGVVFGAGYTDVHVKLLALNIMVGLSLAVAALLVANIFRRTWRPAMAGA
ncbi:MAG TPA: UPF0182 family protein, partial [Synergistales bacterium]|nr:UPF0182 family protein [Synergistales bacterium]